MKPAVKFIFFFVMVFIIGFVYSTLNNFGLVVLEQEIENQSALPQHPYPTIDTVYTFLWMGIPLIAIISTAIYLAIEGRGLI